MPPGARVVRWGDRGHVFGMGVTQGYVVECGVSLGAPGEEWGGPTGHVVRSVGCPREPLLPNTLESSLRLLHPPKTAPRSGVRKVWSSRPVSTCLARSIRRAGSDQRPGTCVGCCPISSPLSLEGPWLLDPPPAPDFGFPGPVVPSFGLLLGAGGERRTGQTPTSPGPGAGETTGTTNIHRCDPALLPLSCFVTSLSFAFCTCHPRITSILLVRNCVWLLLATPSCSRKCLYLFCSNPPLH